ncbi:MAG TPA: alpha/beta hydrolase-fold protein [Polyangia bacterium]|nr:alpha/beta hydrolase-fold protein [Polyangia bacterium]
MKWVRSMVVGALVASGCGSGHVGTPRDAGAGGTGGESATGGGVASGGTGGVATANGGTGGDEIDASANGGGPASTGGHAGGGPDDGGPPDTTTGGFDSSSTDPGADGDGERTLNPPFKNAPEYTAQAGVPKGAYFEFAVGVASTIYPKAPTTRKIGVYVPAQYVAGTPAPVIVFQDGTDFYGFSTSIPTVLDNVIAKGAIPPVVGVFAGNGGGDNVGSERGLEYDTVSGLYAKWVSTELLPLVEQQTKTQLPNQAVTFTKDPEGRATMGGSSGGLASFSMAWWHPDLFRRVLSFSGSYVNQVPADSPFPHGGWIYHDVDPFDATTPNGLVVAHCESATSPAAGVDDPGPCDTPLSESACLAMTGCAWNTSANKPIRVWMESGTKDSNSGDAPSTYRNFALANQRMADSLAKRHYHYHHDLATGAGHVDMGPLKQTLPEALAWVWRGYVPSGR